jgi:hypothetical protein
VQWVNYNSKFCALWQDIWSNYEGSGRRRNIERNKRIADFYNMFRSQKKRTPGRGRRRPFRSDQPWMILTYIIPVIWDMSPWAMMLKRQISMTTRFSCTVQYVRIWRRWSNRTCTSCSAQAQAPCAASLHTLDVRYMIYACNTQPSYILYIIIFNLLSSMLFSIIVYWNTIWA